MPTSDPIADMLTRIRNASRVKARQVRVKRSKVCLGLAGVLKDEGYIVDFDVIEDTNQGEIRIDLKYGERREPVITELRRASRPGRRIYRGADALPRPLDGLGVSIVSTSRGVLSDRKARELNVGGELLCTVW
jgi:small subunit ribosomal protein S8